MVHFQARAFSINFSLTNLGKKYLFGTHFQNKNVINLSYIEWIAESQNGTHKDANILKALQVRVSKNRSQFIAHKN